MENIQIVAIHFMLLNQVKFLIAKEVKLEMRNKYALEEVWRAGQVVDLPLNVCTQLNE